MEEHKRKVSGMSVSVAAVAAIAIVGIGLNWQVRTELRRDTAALAVLQLRSAVLSSAPYREELGLLQQLTSSDHALSAPMTSLAGLQDTGMPSLTDLTDQLNQAAAVALIAEQSRPEFGVLDSLASKIAATAVVVGLEAGTNPLNSKLGPVVAAAEKSLHEGSVDQALASIGSLPPDLGTNFDAWKANAEARISVQRALSELTGKLAGGTEQKK